MTTSNKHTDGNLDYQRNANSQENTGRNPGLKELYQSSMNKQAGESSKSMRPINRTDQIQGNINLTNAVHNNVDSMKDIDRINRLDDDSGRQHEVDYHSNFLRSLAILIFTKKSMRKLIIL